MEDRSDDVLYVLNPKTGIFEFETRGRFNDWCAGDTRRIALTEPLEIRSFDDFSMATEELTIKSGTYRLMRRDGNIYYAERL